MGYGDDSLDEVPAGEEIYLDFGDLGVDPRTESVFVLRHAGGSGDGEPVLFAIEPDAGGYEKVLELDGYSRIRILFPPEWVLLMCYAEHTNDEGVLTSFGDTLVFLNPYSLETAFEISTGRMYKGARFSPDRRWLMMTNARDITPTVDVMDTAAFDADEPVLAVAHTLPGYGHNRPIAVWAKSAGEIVEIMHVDAYGEHGVLVRKWSLEGYEAPGPWPEPDLELEIADAMLDPELTYHDVDVSPDDALLALPVLDLDHPDHPDVPRVERLALVDLETAEVRYKDGVVGPAAFTPDGSTIIAHRTVEDASTGERRSYLVVIDRETLDHRSVRMPYETGRTVFMSETGIYLGIEPTSGGESSHLAIYDMNRDVITELGPDLGWTDQSVQRPHHDLLYMISPMRGLYRLHLFDAGYEEVPLYFLPYHIAILESRDRIVLDDPSSGRYSLWDLEPFFEIGWIVLP